MQYHVKCLIDGWTTMRPYDTEAKAVEHATDHLRRSLHETAVLGDGDEYLRFHIRGTNEVVKQYRVTCPVCDNEYWYNESSYANFVALDMCANCFADVEAEHVHIKLGCTCGDAGVCPVCDPASYGIEYSVADMQAMYDAQMEADYGRLIGLLPEDDES